jgi:hypothetical protein
VKRIYAASPISFRRKWTRSFAELSSRTFWTLAREFSPFKAARGDRETARLIPDTVLPLYSWDRTRSGSPSVASRRTSARGPWSERWSAWGHAAALRDGHVSQDVDRLAATRARRAAAARDLRSVGTASPVPKYISSGVCPRNAECGSTWLCSWT